MGQCESSVCKLSLSGVAMSQVQAWGRRGSGDQREGPVAAVPLASLGVGVRNPSRSQRPCLGAMRENLTHWGAYPDSELPLPSVPEARPPPGHQPEPTGTASIPQAQGQASAESARASVVGLDLLCR